MSKRLDELRERAQHANTLIRLIGSHGRKFFWSVAHQQFASIEVDDRGRVWFIDDFTGVHILTTKSLFGRSDRDWTGFSHGGTLRSLVEAMRDYIQTGRKIGFWRIASYSSTGFDYWGYGKEASYAVRMAARDLPIIDSSAS